MDDFLFSRPVAINVSALPLHAQAKVKKLRERNGVAYARIVSWPYYNVCTAKVPFAPGDPAYGEVERQLLRNGWELVIGQVSELAQ